jgi:hypothetical protein
MMKASATDKMAATVAAQARQKEDQARFRKNIIESGGDYVIADAVSPHEIFHTLEIPVISLAWYSAVISAKQLSPYYFDQMDRLGYHDGLPRYGIRAEDRRAVGARVRTCTGVHARQLRIDPARQQLARSRAA